MAMLQRGGQQPVFVLKQNSKREHGRKAQIANIQAGKAIADIIRTTLGPSSMLKMLLDPMGGIVLTNDGHAILREIDVMHPAGKTLIEISRSQDEEVGDGCTSVVILAGEVLALSQHIIVDLKMHPARVCGAYMQAVEDAVGFLGAAAQKIDTTSDDQVMEALNACLHTKFAQRLDGLVAQLALKATKTVRVTGFGGKVDIDIKRYAKVEKVPGGDVEESCVLDGVMVNKDVTHPKMKRLIENPRVLLLDCPLEYKKNESTTQMEVTDEASWAKLLQQEEAEVEEMCNQIIASKCNVVVTEKGVSDLAQHFLAKAGISAIRRVRKSDNNRIARATGGKIVSRTEEIVPNDIGTRAKTFKISKIGDEYFTFFLGCEGGGACTILLRGGSKDVLNEIERNLQDAMCVCRNLFLDDRMVTGGGAAEMAVAAHLTLKAKSIDDSKQYAYGVIAKSLEVIPKTIAQNCGANVVRVMSELRNVHEAAAAAGKPCTMGICGMSGVVKDLTKETIFDSLMVKKQVFTAAVEAAAVLLRIDDVLSGVRKTGGGDGAGGVEMADPETFGDARDG